jgi:hypothetical protein
MSNLFREEYLKSQRMQGFGATILPPQRVTRVAAIVALCMLAMFAAVLGVLKYERVVTYRGVFSHNSRTIVLASSSGDNIVVERLLLKAGERVVPGSSVLVASTQSGSSAGPKYVTNTRMSQPSIVVGHDGERRPVSVLMSTQEGYLERYLVDHSQTVAPSQPVALLSSDANQLGLRVLVDSEALGYLRVGEQVYIRVDAFPYQKSGSIKGYVSGISGSAVTPDQGARISDEAQKSLGMFAVEIDLERSNGPAFASSLKPGMMASVDLPREKASLLSWLVTSLKSSGSKNG